MIKTFKQRLLDGDTLRVFGLARIVHPVVVDIFALAGGYDGFWLDQEHSAATTDQINAVSVAARANGMDSFVRIPPIGYWEVTRCLEAGSGGVMAAQIHSAEHARQFVSWCKFAPEGTRGLNTGGRDANYSHMRPAEFVEHANRALFTAIQIETLGSLDEADDIAAIPGVDLLFVGPSDLSLVLGCVGEFHHSKLWEAIEKISQACEAQGKTWGCVAPDAKFAQRAEELGCRMLTMGNDTLMMRRGVDALKAAFEKQF